jgi:hypothetical protein
MKNDPKIIRGKIEEKCTPTESRTTTQRQRRSFVSFKKFIADRRSNDDS